MFKQGTQQGNELVQRISGLGHDKRVALFKRLLEKGIDPGRLPIVALAEGDVPRLSHAQQRQWFLWQLDPQSAAYNMPAALRLEGTLDLAALQSSFDALVARRTPLRTTFEASEGEPLQRIHAAGPVAIERVALPGADDQAIAEAVSREGGRPFDLQRGPLLRVLLLEIGAADRVLVMTQHHIVSDGWSMQVMIAELIQLYQATCEGREAKLPALAIQYADFAAWQRQLLEAGEGPRQLAYWTEQLSNAPAVLELPTDRPRPAVPSHRGQAVTGTLDEPLRQRLVALAQAHGCTLSMVLLASFQLLLRRYSGQSDVCVGMPSAGRNRQEVEPLTGFFVNTLVLRGRLEDGLSTAQLLPHTRATLLAAQANQDLPFEALVDSLVAHRDLSHNPLFQVMFNHQVLGDGLGTTALAGLSLSLLPAPTSRAKFDLALDTQEHGGQLSASLTYATDLFDTATAAKMFAHWQNLLRRMTAEPGKPIAELCMLSEDERNWQLVDLNPGLGQPAEMRTVHGLIQQQAQLRPTAPALVVAGRQLDYQQLNQWANRLAARLHEAGVGPEVRVGIALERSVEMLVALLAVLKAGGAYVPLDPTHPRERLRYMIEDSGVALVLAQPHLLAELPLPASVEVLPVSADGAELQGYSAHDVDYPVAADNLAYLIYTSGSTGRPKGVAVTHGPLAMHCLAIAERYGMTPEDRELQFASINFDGAHERWLVPLVSGSMLMLRDNEAWDVERSAREIAEHGITITCFTPSYLQQLAEHLGEAGADLPIRSYTVGGEGTSRATFEQIQQVLRTPRIINGYGPTETVITPLLWAVHLGSGFDAQYMPVGTPVGARSAYVLGSDLQLLPAGVPGELYIGGEGLARGYHQRPGLTAERFVADPFGPPGGRLYRTGDLVRLRQDGVVEYLGRVDHQVKVRGFRIELGEVESCLMGMEQVREAVVAVAGEGRGSRLVAYLVLAPGLQWDAALRGQVLARLRQALPEYMVPAHLLVLPAMPLNPNGKLDRHALPAPALDRSEHYRAPVTPLEVSLAKLWGELLEVEEVGLDDSFFELGGNSLLAMELVRRVRVAALDGFSMSLRDLMTTPRIGELVGRLQSTASQTPMLLLNTPVPGATPLFCLHGVHGSVFDYLPLARRLQPQWAVHGIQCRMLFNADWVDADVESMAVDYCDYIRAVQPLGPYCLLGWSLGGALALQVARELEAQGQVVAFVGLLDSYLPQADQQQPWDERLLNLLLALGADESASRALCSGWQGPEKDQQLLLGEPMESVLGNLSAPVLATLAIGERVAFVRTTLQLDRVAMAMKDLPGTRVKPTCWWAAGREEAARSSLDAHYGTALRHLNSDRGHFDLPQDGQLIEAVAGQLQGIEVERQEAAFEV